jgi:hypothetical protein
MQFFNINALYCTYLINSISQKLRSLMHGIDGFASSGGGFQVQPVLLERLVLLPISAIELRRKFRGNLFFKNISRNFPPDALSILITYMTELY